MTKKKHPARVAAGLTIGKKNLKSWQKGQSGNPAGRKVGTRTRETVIREWLECGATDGLGGTMQDQIVRAQLLKAMKGDAHAYNAMMDGMHGKISDVHKFSGIEDAPPIKTENTSSVPVTPEDIAMAFAKLIRES